MAEAQQATLYRMVMADHVCPFGLKARDMLKRQGYQVDDHPLTSRQETDAFMDRHGVETTPQVFIGGERIGGYDALKRLFGKAKDDPDAPSYGPVLAVFGMTALMALALSWGVLGTLISMRAVEWFIALSMATLAMLKLRDLSSFTTMFLNYDLLARRDVRYAYVYPFAEGLAGVLMLAGAALWLAVPVALVIGTIGAVSVIKAVYVDKRELKCACVGGDSNVPLGAISLTENLMMVAMALWMMVR